MSELRARPGEILDDVSERGQVFLVERKGMPLACLVPVEHFMPDIPESRLVEELADLHEAEKADYSIALSAQREIVIRVPGSSERANPFLEIVLPHGYPNVAPIVRASPVDENAPHRWPNGSLCVFGMTTHWNPGTQGVISTIQLGRRWLKGYENWKRTGLWPQIA